MVSRARGPSEVKVKECRENVIARLVTLGECLRMEPACLLSSKPRIQRLIVVTHEKPSPLGSKGVLPQPSLGSGLWHW
jgi:hypothetical protein